MVQTQLDIASLERTKDRALYVVDAFADPIWKREAVAALDLLCRRGDDFTGDDVWRLLSGVNAATSEPRALGALITRFAREGKIYATGAYRKSVRKECHRRPLAVWRPALLRHNRREAV